MFGRGAGGIAKSFDARQKIGANDVRQRLGGGTGKGRHHCFCKLKYSITYVLYLAQIYVVFLPLTWKKVCPNCCSVPPRPPSVSGERCQRKVRSERCSFQNPWQGRSRRSAGCPSDDQLTQTGAKSIRCPCADHANAGSNTQTAGPDPCAADTDTHQQQSCQCEHEAVWPDCTRTEYEKQCNATDEQ